MGGEFRTVYIYKRGHLFGLATFLEPALQEIPAKLAAEKHLVKLDPENFVDCDAYFIGE